MIVLLLMKFFLFVINVILVCILVMSDEEIFRWKGLICEIFFSLFILVLIFILNYRENF